MSTLRAIAKATICCSSLIGLCGCSSLLGPKVECHTEEQKGPPASVTPPDSLHLPTVTLQITTQKRVCERAA